MYVCMLLHVCMYVCKVNYLCICAEPHTHTYSSNSFVLQLYVFLLHIICMYVCMYVCQSSLDQRCLVFRLELCDSECGLGCPGRYHVNLTTIHTCIYTCIHSYLYKYILCKREFIQYLHPNMLLWTFSYMHSYIAQSCMYCMYKVEGQYIHTRT